MYYSDVNGSLSSFVLSLIGCFLWFTLVFNQNVDEFFFFNEYSKGPELALFLLVYVSQNDFHFFPALEPFFVHFSSHLYHGMLR